MDSLHAIGFYVSSGISLAGALGVALLPRRGQRGAALGMVGLGLAGLYASLSAGVAAPLALVCYLGAAWVIAGPPDRAIEGGARAARRPIAAVRAGGVRAVCPQSGF